MEINREKDFLPVGSVVSIRYTEGKFMIVGFCTKTAGDDKIYEYSAVPYPMGLISLDRMTVFDRMVVKKVYHIGFLTTEHEKFIKEIERALNKKREADNNG